MVWRLWDDEEFALRVIIEGPGVHLTKAERERSEERSKSVV